jgi:hypothetical protein
MIARFLARSFIVLVAVASSRADLQLAPRIVDYQMEQMTFKQLAFSDGSPKDITYSPPDGWDYSGSAAQLTLHPPNKSQAEAIVFKVPLSGPAGFDEATVKKLVDEAIASVPAGGTHVDLVSQEKNPLMIEGKETFLVILSYQFHNEARNRSILFLNRGKEQIRFQLTSRQADFQELQKAFLGSQYSWQNL